jgi:hypothetical protein
MGNLSFGGRITLKYILKYLKVVWCNGVHWIELGQYDVQCQAGIYMGLLVP